MRRKRCAVQNQGITLTLNTLQNAETYQKMFLLILHCATTSILTLTKRPKLICKDLQRGVKLLRETLTVRCSQHFKSNIPYFRRSPKVVTIFPRAEMGSESIAYVAEWAIVSETIRARGIIMF